MIGYAISKNGVTIRLTEERWFHISESHDYLSGYSDIVLEAINDPEEILEGRNGELIAVKKFKDKHMIAVYKEVSKKDGFVVTAFVTSESARIKKGRRIAWKKE